MNKNDVQEAQDWFDQILTDYYDGQTDIGDDYKHVQLFRQALQSQKAADFHPYTPLAKLAHLVVTMDTEDSQDKARKLIGQIKTHVGHTNERVQELEEECKSLSSHVSSLDKACADLEIKNERLHQNSKGQDQKEKMLLKRLKVATQALEGAKDELGNAFPTDEISIAYGIIKQGLEQINGGRDD